MKRVEESDTKLAQALSLVTAKFAEMKTMKKQHTMVEWKFYDMGFLDAKNLVDNMVREAWLGSFMDGWVVALDVLNVPLNSPYCAMESVLYPAKMLKRKEDALESSTLTPLKGVLNNATLT